MFECRCEGDRNGIRVSVKKGRVMRICDSCKGWWYEPAYFPVIRAPQKHVTQVLRKVTISGRIVVLTVSVNADVAELEDARDLKSL